MATCSGLMGSGRGCPIGIDRKDGLGMVEQAGVAGIEIGWVVKSREREGADVIRGVAASEESLV